MEREIKQHDYEELLKTKAKLEKELKEVNRKINAIS